MSLNIWLAFVAVAFVVSGSPGPNMLLSLTHGIHHGLTGTFGTMLGLLSGLAIILAISFCGLGAVYLVYLGIRIWRTADTRLITQTRLAAWLRRGQRMHWFNRTSGAVFIGAGVLLGTLRR